MTSSGPNGIISVSSVLIQAKPQGSPTRMARNPSSGIIRDFASACSLEDVPDVGAPIRWSCHPTVRLGG